MSRCVQELSDLGEIEIRRTRSGNKYRFPKLWDSVPTPSLNPAPTPSRESVPTPNRQSNDSVPTPDSNAVPTPNPRVEPEVESESSTQTTLIPAPVDEVLAHYVSVMKPRWSVAKAGDDVRKLVRDALKVATVDELKLAIDGCARSPYHMGTNPQRKRYNSLSHIMKARREAQMPNGNRIAPRTLREAIDYFIDLSQTPASRSHSSDASAKLSADARERLDANVRRIERMLANPVAQNLEQGQSVVKAMQRYGLALVFDSTHSKVSDIQVIPGSEAASRPQILDYLRLAFGLHPEGGR